jgi:hypothetical protein
MPGFQGPFAGGPAVRGVTIVPSDTVDLPSPTRGIWVGGGGNLAVILAGDTVAITLTAVPIGRLELAARRVMATNTTATLMVALF